MRYEQLQHQPRETFRRVCGVSPETFEQMVDALEAAEADKTKPGRPCELSLADRVLLMLRYHYDYDTQARLGVDFGLSESTFSHLIRRVESRLLGDARYLTLLRRHPPDWPAHNLRLLDMGYQGLQHDTPRVFLPFKATPGHALDDEQRAYNRLHAAVRIRVEYVIRALKRFHILALRYRNRRRRFHPRLNLIAAIYNLKQRLAA